METYIWNTEYEVYATVASSLENARWQLKNRWYHKGLEDSSPDNGIDLQTNLNRARAYFNSAQEFFDTMAKEPSYILKEKESIIYDHSNE